MTNYKKEWDTSYSNKDNFIFYPHEEIIRFVSKYIRKRIGFNNFEDKCQDIEKIKVLDVGCGIGRHVFFLDDFKLNSYGFDLSQKAIDEAKGICASLDKQHLTKKICVADILDLPYEDDSFSFLLSHGVLDSMPFSVAKEGIKELARISKRGAVMYADLIDIKSSKNGEYEELVDSQHEKGTIQSYFDENRINELLSDKFVLIEKNLITREDSINNGFNSRWHIIAKKQ